MSADIPSKNITFSNSEEAYELSSAGTATANSHQADMSTSDASASTSPTSSTNSKNSPDFFVVYEDGEEHLVRPEWDDPWMPATRLNNDGHPYCINLDCPLTFPYHLHV